MFFVLEKNCHVNGIADFIQFSFVCSRIFSFNSGRSEFRRMASFLSMRNARATSYQTCEDLMNEPNPDEAVVKLAAPAPYSMQVRAGN